MVILAGTYVEQMMHLYNLVVGALKEKAPGLHKSLAAAGTLREYAQGLAEQASTEIVTLTQADRARGNWDSLGPVECARKMAMAQALNQEVVLADLLEFPQDGTSPRNPDETTNSDPMT